MLGVRGEVPVLLALALKRVTVFSEPRLVSSWICALSFFFEIFSLERITTIFSSKSFTVAVEEVCGSLGSFGDRAPLCLRLGINELFPSFMIYVAPQGGAETKKRPRAKREPNDCLKSNLTI